MGRIRDDYKGSGYRELVEYWQEKLRNAEVYDGVDTDGSKRSSLTCIGKRIDQLYEEYESWNKDIAISKVDLDGVCSMIFIN